MPNFSQIPPKTKEWHPLKYPGTGPFLRVFAGKNFPAVGRQPCSQVIYLKIWENLLIYYLGKVKKFEKHRMIGSIFKNVISVGGAYMPPPGFLGLNYNEGITWAIVKKNFPWKILNIMQKE